MNLLFIGGTGNISSACAALLQQRGHEIWILSRGRRSVPEGYQAFAADRNDAASVRQALGKLKPDVVLNFIGYELSEVRSDYELFRDVGQYLFISSTTVYAKPPTRLPIPDDAPLGNAFWPYAQKKQLCEEWLLEQWTRNGFPVTIVRPSLTYSHRWIPNPLSSSSYTFAKRLEEGKPVYVPDDGETPWTVTAADDFAVGLAGLVGRSETHGQAFHITSDEVLTWNRITAEIAAAVGATDPKILQIPTDFICDVAPQMVGTLKGDKSHPGVFDNRKIKRFVPDFVCRKPFRQGVRESVNWLRAHPAEQNLNAPLDAVCDAVVRAWQNRS